MNDYIREDTAMSKQFNEFIFSNTKLLNEFIGKSRSVTTSNTIKDFTRQAQELFDNFYKDKRNDNIFQVIPGIYIPLLALARQYQILEFINVIPSGLLLFDQYKYTRHQYYKIYERFNEELVYAGKALEKVHSALN